jgi:GntR family transcriptional repressor for pyruvate dehydrogenase complex
MVLVDKFPEIHPTEQAGQPGYEQVAQRIVTYIRTEHLQPGDRLPTERALGEQLGVSRTVIREAVKMLSALGIVRVRQGSGLYVNSESQPFTTTAIMLPMTVSPENVQSLFDFRFTIETQTARLAAERITPRDLRVLEEIVERNYHCAEIQDIPGLSESDAQFYQSDAQFHHGIAEATHNPFFISSVTAIFRLQHWVTSVVTENQMGSYLRAAQQHRTIFTAIKNGQPEEAAEAMREHITTVLNDYTQEVQRRLWGEI